MKALRHLSRMQAGFVVSKVVLKSMQAGAGGQTEVQYIDAEGLLAVHESDGAAGVNLAQTRYGGGGGVNGIR